MKIGAQNKIKPKVTQTVRAHNGKADWVIRALIEIWYARREVKNSTRKERACTIDLLVVALQPSLTD